MDFSQERIWPIDASRVMRPTLFQVHCNGNFFIELLEQAGFPDARAKMGALSYKLVEYYSVEQAYTRAAAELQRNQQHIHRYPLNPRSRRTPAQEKIRMIKSVGSSRRLFLKYGQYVNRKRIYLERKIAEWPELTYVEKDLQQKVSAKERNRITAKRARRPRRVLDL